MAVDAHSYAVDTRVYPTWYHFQEDDTYETAFIQIESNGAEGEFIICNKIDDQGRECFCLAAKTASGSMQEYMIIPKPIQNNDIPPAFVPGIAFEDAVQDQEDATTPKGAEPDGFQTLIQLVAYCTSRRKHPLKFKLKLNEEDDNSDVDEEENAMDGAGNFGEEAENDLENKTSKVARSSSMAHTRSASAFDNVEVDKGAYEVVFEHYVVDPAFEKSHTAIMHAKKTAEVAEHGGTKGKGSTNHKGSTKGPKLSSSSVQLIENEAAHQSEMMLWSDFSRDLTWPELDQLNGSRKPEVVSLQWLGAQNDSVDDSNLHGTGIGVDAEEHELAKPKKPVKEQSSNELLAVVVEVSDKDVKEEDRERNLRVAVYQPKTGELSYVISKQFKGKDPAKPEVRWIARNEGGDPTLLFFNNDSDAAPRFFDVVQIKVSDDGTISGMYNDNGNQKCGIRITRSRAPLGDFGLSLGKGEVKFAGEKDEIELERIFVSRPSKEAATKDENTSSDPNAQLWEPVYDAPLVIVGKADQEIETPAAALVVPSKDRVENFQALFMQEWPREAGDIINMKNADGDDVAMGKSKLYCGIAKPKVPAEFTCVSTAGLNFYNKSDLKATTVVKMLAGNWSVNFKTASHLQATSYFGEEKYQWDHAPDADVFTGKLENKGQSLAGDELLVQSSIGSGESQNSYSDYGVFFDVTAQGDAVALLTVLAGSKDNGPSTGTLYYRVGTHVGYEESSSGWDTACREVKLTTGGGSTSTLDTPIVVQAGQTIGFYCHGPSHNESVAYVAQGQDSLTGDTGLLTMSIGKVTQSKTPFHSAHSEKRQFAGGIGFKVLREGSEDDANAEPTLAEMPGRIRKAIIKGVPLWNARKHADCTKLYYDVATRYAKLEPFLAKALDL